MNWDVIVQAAVSALMVSAAATLPPLAVAAFRLLMRKAGLVTTVEQEAKIRFAVEAAVAAAAERMRYAALGAGEQKHAMAVQMASTLAKEFDVLPSENKSIVVDATYQKMRQSLPPPPGASP